MSGTGEIVEGKRTLIEHNGHEFELPQGHTADLVVGLNTPGEGSSFIVREFEVRDDAVVLHIGEEIGSHGIGTAGDARAEVHGYQFPRK